MQLEDNPPEGRCHSVRIVLRNLQQKTARPRRVDEEVEEVATALVEHQSRRSILAENVQLRRCEESWELCRALASENAKNEGGIPYREGNDKEDREDVSRHQVLQSCELFSLRLFCMFPVAAADDGLMEFYAAVGTASLDCHGWHGHLEGRERWVVRDL